ncbi:thioredoxin [Solemya pervernicosa gill symbiont]|uniref:Thioredoxin n=1 Tax=Solemya pervernicosa gill symbiont TaxID=642797 RepID=A0A1T2L8K5_9GAMM|nr:thioredoxin [Solemya pervernicosa gill symbiont]
MAAISLLIFTVTIEAASVETRDPYVHFFDQFFGDLQEELANAKEEGKKGVLIFFEMDECPFCHRMKRTVLNRPEVQKFFKENMLSFAIDIEGDVEMVDFKGETMSQKDFSFKVNRVRATPVIAFYDLQGEQVVRYTGATSGPDEFLWMGEYFVDGHYQKQSFTRYKREKRKASKNR